jgi:hypothetical protein
MSFTSDAILVALELSNSIWLVDACCDAWNALLAETGRVASLGRYGY